MANIATLVMGESGTGKELVARVTGLSRFSPFDTEKLAFTADYASGYHTVNLSALSPALIESGLFAHKRGAFTGATEDRNGWLESMTRSSSTRSGSSRWRYR
jgi:DNA-binding NtrC family response regulator